MLFHVITLALLFVTRLRWPPNTSIVVNRDFISETMYFHLRLSGEHLKLRKNRKIFYLWYNFGWYLRFLLTRAIVHGTCLGGCGRS